MKQHHLKVASLYKPHFRVIKGAKEQVLNVDQLTNTAWNFAHTALWNNCIFSKTEIERSKNCIKEMFIASRNPTRAYNTFCQRVLLARQYVNSQPNRYIPLPTVWLDKENPTGFAGTKLWYMNIRELRSSLPNYKIELKAFGEAILEMNEEATHENFQYWRNYFIEKQMPGLLTLFLNTVANQQFGI